ncbi:MAG: ribonuclease [Eubacteriaceae bacterium]|jgi:ribonuclease HII|nr:ribonuclease [Eubacteriaceae bacterium]
MDFTNQTVSQIKKIIDNAPIDDYLKISSVLLDDSRESVKKIGASLSKKKEKYDKELKRIRQLKEQEIFFHKEGHKRIAGIDEVGRGPLAGPVVTCAIIMPIESEIMFVNDSKLLSKKRREDLNQQILAECLDYQIGMMSPEVIDAINILNATKKAMSQAVENLKLKPDLLLLDAVTLDMDIPQKGIIKGDTSVYAIACASIVAKVFRDQMMSEIHKDYPEYGFEQNMGYGTAQHIDAIKKFGPTPYHRQSFIKNFL